MFEQCPHCRQRVILLRWPNGLVPHRVPVITNGQVTGTPFCPGSGMSASEVEWSNKTYEDGLRDGRRS